MDQHKIVAFYLYLRFQQNSTQVLIYQQELCCL